MVSRALQEVHMRQATPATPTKATGSANGHLLTLDTINENVRRAEYAVRGKLYEAAVARARSGKRVIYTNVGNPHQLGQPPITFFRQVLALVNYPALLDAPEAASLFPPDAISRAKKYLSVVPGGTGAYQDSRGNEYVRGEVAAFLGERDDVPGDVNDIFLTDGASNAVSHCLRISVRGRRDGVLVPVPQYPLYSATVELVNGTQLGYYLDESSGWALSTKELQRVIREGRGKGIEPRALVVINPGNPTGQCLDEENLRDIVRLCRDERLVIFADEVYQTNVYGENSKFVSFRKVILEMGEEAANVECFSFHTVSKGALGECGRRGAYVHCHNIDDGVKAEMYKLLSTNLSSNVDGQLMLGMMVNPPRPGEPSYELYKREMDGVLNSLSRRAKRLSKAFNELPGMSCNDVDGALYAFPRIELPEGAVAAAKKAGVPADVQYCLELLDHTGICCVPGSGFGQRDGTLHFRTTILPQEKEFDEIIGLFTDFHNSFMKKYGGEAGGNNGRRRAMM